MSASDVFDNAIKYLSFARAIITDAKFWQLVHKLGNGECHIWVTGMGKAGLVAEKLASTLASNGIPAAYIRAGEALHGGLGAIQRDDILVAFSNSGKTDEIIQIVTKCREYAFVALITGAKASELADLSDICLCYGEVEEACALGLTPTTSIMVMLAIADALAMAVQEKVGLTYSSYARYHHSGYLGQIARQKEKGDDAD
jgi:arabinose-5-phosphate isomerase